MNQELVDYIKQQMNLNVSKNKIIDILLGQGWQQVEIDEAMTAAEGASMSLKFSGKEPGRSEDYSDSGEDSGSNRKTIVAVASVLAAVAVLAGIMILPSIGPKTDDNTAPVDVAVNVNTNTPDPNNAPTTTVLSGEEAMVAAAVAAGNAALAEAAKDLSVLIVPPAGWTPREGVMRSKPLAAFFKPTAEKDTSGKEFFNENISVIQENVKVAGITTLNEYVAKARARILAEKSGHKITAERKVNLGDASPAVLMGSTFTQNGVAMRSMQLYALKGDYAYVTTAVVLASNWESEKDMLGTSVMSFKYPVQN